MTIEYIDEIIIHFDQTIQNSIVMTPLSKITNDILTVSKINSMMNSKFKSIVGILFPVNSNNINRFYSILKSDIEQGIINFKKMLWSKRDIEISNLIRKHQTVIHAYRIPSYLNHKGGELTS